MSDFSYQPHKSLGFMTITVNRLMSAFLRKKMREAGIDLTSEQWGVLVLLWNEGGVTQEELARHCCVDKSSMSRVLALMESKNLILRRVDPADGRRKIIRPSGKAAALRRQSLGVAREVLDLALKGVSPHDHDQCLAVLDTVKRNLRHAGSGVPDPGASVDRAGQA